MRVTAPLPEGGPAEAEPSHGHFLVSCPHACDLLQAACRTEALSSSSCSTLPQPAIVGPEHAPLSPCRLSAR